MNELTIQEIEVKPITACKIECNFDVVEKQLDDILESNRDVFIGEYDIKPAKKTRADLNKLKTAFNDKKKVVKKAVNIEYVPFEGKTKILMGKIDTVIAGIDSQLEFYENKRKEEKETLIYNLIDGIKNCEADIPFKEEWLNSSCSNKKIKDEVELWYETTNANLEAIELEQSDYEAELKMMICNGVSMADVLIKKKQLEMAHERSLQIEEAKSEEVNNISTPTENTHLEDITFTLEISCSVQQSNKLKHFMDQNNIKSERRK